MSAAILLAQGVIAALPTLEVGVQEAWNFINTVRAAAQQTGEWSAAQEDAYQQALLADAQDKSQQQ